MKRIVIVLAVLAGLQLCATAGTIVLVADFSDPHQFGRLDLGTGAYTPIGTSEVGEFFNGPGSSLYGFRENGDVVRVANNGATTFVGNIGLVPDEPAGLMDGTMYTTDVNTHILYTINPLNGTPTLVGPTGFVDPPGGVFFLTLIAGQTNTLYAIATSFDATTLDVIDHARLFRIDRTTGAATFLANVNDDLVTCALIANGTTYLFDFTAQISTLNLSTGATTPLYDLSGSLEGINGIAFPTPEPSTWSSAFLAGGVLLWAGRHAGRARRNP